MVIKRNKKKKSSKDNIISRENPIMCANLMKIRRKLKIYARKYPATYYTKPTIKLHNSFDILKKTIILRMKRL